MHISHIPWFEGVAVRGFICCRKYCRSWHLHGWSAVCPAFCATLFLCLTSEGKTSWQSCSVVNTASICPSAAHILDSDIRKRFPLSPPVGMKSQQLALADGKSLFAVIHTNKAGCFRGTVEVGKMWGVLPL